MVKIVKQEMSLFENGGLCGHHLELVFKYLTFTPPITIETKLAFPAAYYIRNKLRNRFKDDTLDALPFLRSYFQNNQIIKNII